MEKAAVIVHGRTRYRDYRPKFLVRPVDMEDHQIYRWKALIQRCTGSPEEMRETRRLRRAVIAADGYTAVGIAGYFRDMYPASFEDEGMRPVQGFVGFIWKTADMSGDERFPRQQAFRSVIEEYVIPRWEEPKNSPDGEKASFSDYRDRREGVPGTDRAGEGEEDDGLTRALRRAATGEDVFFCTGLPSETSEESAKIEKSSGKDSGKGSGENSAASHGAAVSVFPDRERGKACRRIPAGKSGGVVTAVCLAVAVLAAALCLTADFSWVRLTAGLVAAAALLSCGWRLARAARGRKTALPDLPADELRDLLNGNRMREEGDGCHGDDMYQL